MTAQRTVRRSPRWPPGLRQEKTIKVWEARREAGANTRRGRASPSLSPDGKKLVAVVFPPRHDLLSLDTATPRSPFLVSVSSGLAGLTSQMAPC